MQIRSITFETPADLKTKFQAVLEARDKDDKLIATVFDAQGNLKLRIPPEDYQAEITQWGKLVNGFDFVWYEATPAKTRGFTINIKDERAEIRFLLWEIMVRQRGEWGQTNLIWVDDEIGFDPIKDYATGKSRKKGVLFMEDISGTMSNGKLACPPSTATDGQVVVVPETPIRYYTKPYKVRFEPREQDYVL